MPKPFRRLLQVLCKFSSHKNHCKKFRLFSLSDFVASCNQPADQFKIESFLSATKAIVCMHTKGTQLEFVCELSKTVAQRCWALITRKANFREKISATTYFHFRDCKFHSQKVTFWNLVTVFNPCKLFFVAQPEKVRFRELFAVHEAVMISFQSCKSFCVKLKSRENYKFP